MGEAIQECLEMNKKRLFHARPEPVEGRENIPLWFDELTMSGC
jgi:hypothetical protein